MLDRRIVEQHCQKGQRKGGLVAKNVYVVARIDEEDGQEVGVADNAIFLSTDEPFDNIAAAGVGGYGDEEGAMGFGGSIADDSFGEKGTSLDGMGGIGDVEASKKLVHEKDVVVPFVV